MLTPTVTRGYHYVGMYRGGSVVRARVHRLVLEAFVGPCPEGQQACHADDDKTNNELTNLRWDSPSANAADMRRNGRNAQARKTKCANGHAYTPENTYVRPDGRGRGCKRCMYDRNKAARARRR
ncbi:HNH endonuclease [Gordonia phage Sour]|uniref:HNH endonuclease n=1 Tax=Gordonia phage Sour TaxID=2182349 RepID=A0A2U8UKK7_9CAUD|nr:HNH endonuclease [Gordonia phage Sour]AWN04235.1 HNH endonuclease [Gordonia phage Sour]